MIVCEFVVRNFDQGPWGLKFEILGPGGWGMVVERELVEQTSAGEFD